MARRILNTCYLVLVLVALSTVAFAIVWTQRNAPLSEEDRDDDDEYKEGDYIPLFANKACPYLGDPCEPYSYFDLPFCPPGDPIPNRKKSFQELLAGDCYVNTQYELRFKMGTTRKLLCEKNLTREEVAKFRDAIANETMYEMYYDNIRLEEQVGVNASDLEFPPIQYQVGLYLIKHLDFHILYLGNKVKAIYVMGHYDFSGEISKDAEIIVVNFTYSVFWEDFESKQENQDEVSDLSKQVGGDDHVPYATTAFVICIWLGLLYAAIVAYTYLRKYFTRISFGEATGVGHGDACSCPRYSSLLGAILGVGTQQFIIICILFVLTYTGHLYPCDHESLFMWLIMSHVLTSIVSGYKAASFHSGFTTHGRVMVLINLKNVFFQTGALYLVPVFIIGLSIIIFKAITTGLSLPPLSLPPEYDTFKYILKIIWIPASIRALIWGGDSFGYSSPRASEITCATIRFQSEIRNQAWYMKTPAHMFFGGLLPFCMICLMMDDIYASLYKLKVCGAFSTMFTAFIIVIIVTVSMGMVCAYYQLSKQDHQWWWRSVFRGGSTAIFMFAYGLYFYARAKARISLSLLEFLCYNACLFYAVFLILGTIGFYASSVIFQCVDLQLKRRN